ncbi:MAG: type II secretion system major pseudopilin GspG [Acidobacteria bacterium]|nr:type II secretion system major pseudopilin GspG [Acidobacteriota bacterium]
MRQAFTLLEMMAVIIILGIMATLVGMNVVGTTTVSRIAATRASMERVRSALVMYKMDLGVYPESIGDLVESGGEERWKGPYLDPPALPRDGWGNVFVYMRRDGSLEPFVLISLGADGKAGGVGDNEDIHSNLSGPLVSQN